MHRLNDLAGHVSCAMRKASAACSLLKVAGHQRLLLPGTDNAPELARDPAGPRGSAASRHVMGEQSARVDAAVSTNRRLVRFGTFELDPCSGELKRNGRRVPLQDQPARALCLLASRPGQLVTRDELRQALWSADTFLEFDTALNIVVTKVRHALGDVAASPRFIETVPKRGYRFIADVRQAEETAPAATAGRRNRAVARPRFADRIDGSADARRAACQSRPSHHDGSRAALLLAGAVSCGEPLVAARPG